MSRLRDFRRSKRPLTVVEVLEGRQLLAAFVVTNIDDSGTGSLRQAILGADAVSGPSTIDFSIPGSGVHDIDLASVLPNITQAVTIDGTSEPGYDGSPLVEIFGGEDLTTTPQVGRGGVGLPYAVQITGNGATVEGLTFNYVIGTAVIITGSDNTVRGDVFGTSVGQPRSGNLIYSPFDGVTVGVEIQSNVAGGGSHNTIGGTTAGSGNQIVSQTYQENGQGILIEGSNGGGSDNLIAGNTIASTLSAIELEGVTGTTIGGTAAGAGNTLTYFNSTGNSRGGGILDNNGSDQTLIEGNSTSGFVNGFCVVDSSDVTIGGTTTAARNVVSGGAAGIQVDQAIPTDPTQNNLIEGNYVGTNASGTAAATNPDQNGIVIESSSFNTIGGTVAGAGNLIAGSTEYGILLSVDAPAQNYQQSDSDLIQGNFIGTDRTGTVKIPNTTGIEDLGSNTTIGGTATGAGNVISGNSGDGIAINGEAATVQGNFIGTDPSGTMAIGNGGDGIDGNIIIGGTIGGTAAGAGNVISANGAAISGLISSALIEGNKVGTDITGTKPLGNLNQGLSLFGAQNTVGGTTPSAANVISANGFDGIDFAEAADGYNLVEGNFIGTDPSGTINLGNGGFGVSIAGSPNTIGGVVAGSGNTVEFNASGNFNDTVGGNVIFGNLPIADLDLTATVTPSAVVTGSNVIFTETVTNQGPITADDVQIFFTLPTPTTFALTAVELPGGGAANLPDSNPVSQFSEPIGNLAPGASYTITVIGVAYATSGIVQVDATVVSAQLDPNPANNTADPALAISPLPADVGVVAGVPKGSAKVGQEVPYTFIVANYGPGTATNVQLAIVGEHPTDAAIEKITTTQGSVITISPSADIINVGTLLANQTATVTVLINPLKSAGDTTVYAFAGWPGPDPNLADNPALVNIPVQGTPAPTPTTVTPRKTPVKTLKPKLNPKPTNHFLTTPAKTPKRVTQVKKS